MKTLIVLLIALTSFSSYAKKFTLCLVQNSLVNASLNFKYQMNPGDPYQEGSIMREYGGKGCLRATGALYNIQMKMFQWGPYGWETLRCDQIGIQNTDEDEFSNYTYVLTGNYFHYTCEVVKTP